jgi:hypothetical protein
VTTGLGVAWRNPFDRPELATRLDHRFERPVDARRCTVQLSTGLLYLDAAAQPATALLGHDVLRETTTDAKSAHALLSSLAPTYRCVAMARDFPSAVGAAEMLLRARGDAVERLDAALGEPSHAPAALIAIENETLGRRGVWLASSLWTRTPDVIVVGDALSQGLPFGALLARADVVADMPQPTVNDEPNDAAARAAAVIGAVEAEGLIEDGRRTADHLAERLRAAQSVCREIERVETAGLSARVTLAKPLTAARIRRAMCERGVLVCVDNVGRLVIDPPLCMRAAEIDVIAGAMRAAVLGLPISGVSACCAACQADGAGFSAS